MAAKLLFIFFGGGIGACLRYLVTIALQKQDAKAFPYGTLAANVIGCALIGAVMAWLAAHDKVKPEIQYAITVGLLGGFTTFSSFAYESMRLANAGEWSKAIVYVALSNGIGIGAAAGMYFLTLRVIGRA